MGDISQHLEGLTEESGKILKNLEEVSAKLEANEIDATEGKAQLKALGEQMATLQAAEKAKRDEAEKAAILTELVSLREGLANTRQPSKAGAIGQGPSGTSDGADDGFFWSLWASKSNKFPELNERGKANLEAMGSTWTDVPGYAKATLGDSAGAGGNIVPQNVVADLTRIATATNHMRALLTVVDAGYVTGVNVPVQGLAPVRAVIAAAGATKANINLTYTTYTATMYTLARIYDVGNQFLRNSRGAAEADVRDSLARAFALGEAYYVLQGSGSSEPKGILTSIGTSGTFVTSFTASATTLAGSSAAAIATATGALANRALHA